MTGRGARIIVTLPGESRGRAISGVVVNDAGQILGIRRQRPGLGQGIEWESRAEAEAVARELAERLPAGAAARIRAA